MKFLYAFAAIGAATFSLTVSAQTMKPGLWEMTHNVRSATGAVERAQAEAQRQMANMPPEQRRMMEEMMKKHGVQMGGGGPGGTTVRTCMTKEMVSRNEMPMQQGTCRTTKQERSGNTLKVAYTCTNPPSSAEGEYTFGGPEAFTMKMTMNSTVAGRADTMMMEGSGRWLSAECGALKPAQPRADK